MTVSAEEVSCLLSDPDPSIRLGAVRLAGWMVHSLELQRIAARNEQDRNDLIMAADMLVGAALAKLRDGPYLSKLIFLPLKGC